MKTNTVLSLLFSALLFSHLTACGPANRVQTTALQQSACLSNQAQPDPGKEPPNPYNTKPEIAVTKATSTLNVMYKNVRFRCEQKTLIEAFLDGQILRVVARPIEMNPSVVAGCDCIYDLGAQVGPLPAGKYTLKVQRQTDNYGGKSETSDLHTQEIELGKPQ